MAENTSTSHFLIANENRLTSPPFIMAVQNGLARETRTTVPTKMDGGAKSFFCARGRVRLTPAKHYAIVPELNSNAAACCGGG
jgi:hypothetical protein